ncbi:MAG: type IX secretion system membrane protein PorP/SprF [Muribaculaceae bacterium]|nr:type IX secretion system membrane protein PorP/SprF [Muribaculaceae bacterium]
MKLRFFIIYTLALLTLILPERTKAQSDAQFTQYFEVPSYYNAAATGMTDFIRIRGGSRLQWVGIDNAPQTFLITADMPLKLFNKRFGIGLMMQQESLGLYKNMMLGAQIGYKFKLFKGEFSAGLQIGFVDESFKGSEVYIPDDDDYHESTDDAIPTTDIKGTALDLGVGIYYKHKYFWAGLSCTHITSPTITLNAENGSGGGDATTEKNYEFQIGRTLYFMAGSNIPIKNTLFEVIPSVLVKSDLTFTTAEITGRVRYNKFLTAGIGYRYNDAISAMVSAEFKNFYIGYSYDYPTSAISKASSGSHEIFAGYSLKLDLSDKNKNKHKSIRIM